MSQICGIDEAGRGCVAGDLCIAACVLKKEIVGLKDSKKLSFKKRELLYEEIVKNSKYLIVSFTSQKIDEIGLSSCFKEALSKIANEFLGFELIFDGNTNFGIDGITTVIKADSSYQAVSAASILAKVTRDREILKYDQIYPQYGFAKHKGYGTKEHVEAIKKYGYSNIHRKSFKIKDLQ